MPDSVLAQIECSVMYGLTGAFFALFIPPLISWLLTRRLLGDLKHLQCDSAFAASVAAAAASAPGPVFFIGTSFASAHMVQVSTGAGFGTALISKSLVSLVAMLLIVLFARATVKMFLRCRESALLVKDAVLPGERLRLAGAVANVDVREVHNELPICCVAGIFHPVVIVSSETLGRLNDAELAGSLAHEAAHVRRLDQMLAATVLFCSDLLPLRHEALLNLYYEYRELAADACACQMAGASDLTSAILHLSTARNRRHPVSALADVHTLGVRIRALVDEPPMQQPLLSKHRIGVLCTLASALLIGLSPALYGFCFNTLRLRL